MSQHQVLSCLGWRRGVAPSDPAGCWPGLAGPKKQFEFASVWMVARSGTNLGHPAWAHSMFIISQWMTFSRRDIAYSFSPEPFISISDGGPEAFLEYEWSPKTEEFNLKDQPHTSHPVRHPWSFYPTKSDVYKLQVTFFYPSPNIEKCWTFIWRVMRKTNNIASFTNKMLM